MISSATDQPVSISKLHGGGTRAERLRAACSAIEALNAPTLMYVAALGIETFRVGLTDLVEEMQGDIEGAPETLGRDQMISGYIRTIERLLKETA